MAKDKADKQTSAMAVATRSGVPSTGLVAIPTGNAFAGFKQLTSPIIKPAAMENGAIIIGKIIGAVASGKKQFKKPLVQLELLSPSADGNELNETGRKIQFPLTAVIQRCLLGHVDDADTKKLIAEVEKNKGKTILIQKTGSKVNEGGKKPTHLFEVYLKD